MMDRSSFLKHLALASAAPLVLPACDSTHPPYNASPTRPDRSAPPADSSDTSPGARAVHPLRSEIPPIDRSLEEWDSLLDPKVYATLFQSATESRYSSPLLNEQRAGTYICAACRLPLFSSKTKYDSGTGWPSFWAPLLEERIDTEPSTTAPEGAMSSHTAYRCVRCEGHQGHIFKDGPEPSGLRYCNNGRALSFVSKEKSLPPLRT
jgi:peptide-methionine (R)-S-oxide reductase